MLRFHSAVLAEWMMTRAKRFLEQESKNVSCIVRQLFIMNEIHHTILIVCQLVIINISVGYFILSWGYSKCGEKRLPSFTNIFQLSYRFSLDLSRFHPKIFLKFVFSKFIGIILCRTTFYDRILHILVPLDQTNLLIYHT